jgi:hypothetical protein
VFRDLLNNSDDINDAIAAISMCEQRVWAPLVAFYASAAAEIGAEPIFFPRGRRATRQLGLVVVGHAHQRCTQMQVQVVMEGIAVAQNFQARWWATVVGQMPSQASSDGLEGLPHLSLAGVGQRDAYRRDSRSTCDWHASACLRGRRRNGKGQ